VQDAIVLADRILRDVEALSSSARVHGSAEGRVGLSADCTPHQAPKKHFQSKLCFFCNETYL
jgi:hypothetical protein